MKEFDIKKVSVNDLKAMAFDIRTELDRYNTALTQIVQELNLRAQKQGEKNDTKKDETASEKPGPEKS